MTKIRITLLLIALGIGLPASAIVWRAVESLSLENAFRHEAVAERFFDEMERSLSDFLLREEARPPSDYDSGVGQSGAHSQPSSVFVIDDEPYILGWFSLDASGKTRVIASQPRVETRIIAAVESAFGPSSRQPESTPPLALALATPEIDLPSPGRTSSTGRARAAKKSRQPEAGKDLDSESSAYDVLQNLNRAQSLRSERQGKTLPEKPASGPLWDFALSAPSAPGDAPEPGEDQRSAESSERLAPLAEQEEVASLTKTEAGSAAARIEPKALEAKSSRDSESIDPLIGRLTGAGEIVLTRSVWRRGRVDRQGLVLDRDALVQWLHTRVLSETGLEANAQLDFAAPDLPPRARPEHRYLHRFAEPFDGLVARLDLAPLAGLSSARPIYLLAGLLLLVGAIGFFAVDRMTRVVVEYAKRRSNFVAAVSHELKTPLTAIRMYGEMLRDGLVPTEEKRSEYYETITAESERLSRLIDNVLEFSRLEQDRRDLDLVVGDLSSTLEEALEKLRPQVAREGFDLESDLAKTQARVQYDRDAMIQILFNLVDNALKYARHAEDKRIVIQLHQKDARLELSVRDFGPGVPERLLQRIFEPFYRVGEELTRTTEGTGIGLALVKELVEKTGGRVHASNPDGGGFLVRIEFDVLET